MKTLRIFLFEWDKQSAHTTIQQLQMNGYVVHVESENGARGSKRVITDKPDVILFDLAHKPSHSYETAEALRWRKDCKHIPMIFLNGTNAIKEKTQKKVADAVFITTDQILDTLRSYSIPIERSENRAETNFEITLESLPYHHS